MSSPWPNPALCRALYRLQQQYSILDTMLISHKAPQGVVKAWMASFAAAKTHVAGLLTTSPVVGPPSGSDGAVDIATLITPFADVIQQYNQAGGQLLTFVVECLLEFEPLFETYDGCVGDGAAIEAVTAAIAFCHFQSSDQDADDTISFLTLDLAVRCVTSPNGVHLSSGTLIAVLENFVYISLEGHPSILMRLHASRCIETLYGHVFSQLARLVGDGTEPQTPTSALGCIVNTPSTAAEPYDAHTCKTLLHKVTALLKKSGDVQSLSLGLRLLDVLIGKSGPALLSRHVDAVAILSHIKTDVCFQLIHIITNAGTALDMLDVLPVCQTLWQTCGVAIAAQFEVILHAIHARHVQSMGVVEVKSQALSALLSLSSSHTLGPDGNPLSFLQFCFSCYDANPAGASVCTLLCSTAVDVVASICKDSSAATSACDLWSCVNFLRSCTIQAAQHRATHSQHGGKRLVGVPDGLRTHLSLVQVYETAAQQFNVKPRHGIETLTASGVFPTPISPVIVAHFLRFARQLDKTLVGVYLGEGQDDWANGVRSEYCKLFDFKDKPILEALRAFVRAFQLPKEAQQIDRVIQAFSVSVCEQCSEREYFATPDVAYLLSVSLVMLNTSLHNPSVKANARMTLESFLITNENYGPDINKGVSLPVSMLTQVYTELQSEPLRPPVPADVTPDTLHYPKLDKQLFVDVTARAEASFAPEYVCSCTALGFESSQLNQAMLPLLWHAHALVEFEVLGRGNSKLGITGDSIRHALTTLAAVAVDTPALSSHGVDAIIAQLCDLLLKRLQPASTIAGGSGSGDGNVPIHKLVKRLEREEALQVALAVTFQLSRDYGCSLSAVSWTWVLRVLLCLNNLRLIDGTVSAFNMFTLEDVVKFDDSHVKLWKARQKRLAAANPTPSQPSPDDGIERRTSLLGWLLGGGDDKPNKPSSDVSQSNALPKKVAPPSPLTPLHGFFKAMNDDGNSGSGSGSPVAGVDVLGTPSVDKAVAIIEGVQSTFGQLVADSRFLDTPALVRLCVAALYLSLPAFVTMPPTPSSTDAHLLPRACLPLIQKCTAACECPPHPLVTKMLLSDTDHAVLMNFVLSELCIRNRDRLPALLDVVLSTFQAWFGTLASGSSSVVGVNLRLHTAVSGLFSLCARLLTLGHKLALRSILDPLLASCRASSDRSAVVECDDGDSTSPLALALQLHFACGVRQLLAPHIASLLQSSQCWSVLLELACQALHNGHSGRIVLNAVTELLAACSPESLQSVASTTSAVVYDVLPSSLLQPLAVCLSPPYPIDELSMSALDLLQRICEHVMSRLPDVIEDADTSSVTLALPTSPDRSKAVLLTDTALSMPFPRSDSNDSISNNPLLAGPIPTIASWVKRWVAVVSAVRAGCGTHSYSVRIAVLNTLQRMFMSVKAEQLPSAIWYTLLEDVLLGALCQVIQTIIGVDGVVVSSDDSKPVSMSSPLTKAASKDAMIGDEDGYTIVDQHDTNPSRVSGRGSDDEFSSNTNTLPTAVPSSTSTASIQHRLSLGGKAVARPLALQQRDLESLVTCGQVCCRVLLHALPVLVPDPRVPPPAFSELWLVILYFYQRLCDASVDPLYTDAMSGVLRNAVMVVRSLGLFGVSSPGRASLWSETLRIVQPLCKDVDWDDPVAAGEALSDAMM